MKRAIEVKFYVLEDEIITEKLRKEISRKINESVNEIDEKYKKISKIFDYSPDWGDFVQTFAMMYRKKIVTNAARISFKSNETFEDVALTLVDETMEEAISGEEFIEAICAVIRNALSKSYNAYDSLSREEMISILKMYF